MQVSTVRLLAILTLISKKKIVGDDEIITCRPADLIHDKIDDFKDEIKEYYEQEEDILSYAQFGQVAVKFFQKRRDKNTTLMASMRILNQRFTLFNYSIT